jgi:GTP-binding protein EngB required for normal cell division
MYGSNVKEEFFKTCIPFYILDLCVIQVPLTVVFTKCDRKKKKKNGGKKPEENVKDFVRQLKEFVDPSPPWIMTSCVTNQGKEGLLMHIAQLRNYWKS